jgi:pimeloyl-ACP methyl ester carboxylesterase
VRLIPHARHAVVPATGHLGFLLKPDLIADMIRKFATRAT